VTIQFLGLRRLRAQQISHHDFKTARDVVTWLGAVQAQDWAASKWAVGLRLPNGTATDEAIERAVDQAAIVRIHALRWTWQLVAPQDVRWILALVGPRLVEKSARRHRELELDAGTVQRSNVAIAKALRNGVHMTRAEIATLLKRTRISAAGQRLPHLLARAELEGLLCSGARRGKQPTWALLDERVPATKPLDRRDALARLAQRYFRSRGPATVNDLRWWAGLSAADSRAAIESTSHTLAAEVIGGRTHWYDPSLEVPRSSGAYLLPAFDEYLVAYQNRDAVLAPDHVKRINAGGGMLGPCIVRRGVVIGTWRRTLGPTTVRVEHELFVRASAEERRAIALPTTRYAAFVGRVL
jgi:hypothetical protein